MSNNLDETNKIVTLTELEFHKLLRFSELAISTESQAQTALTQLKAKVTEVIQKREDYFESLSKKYPNLDKDKVYIPNEDTFELVLQEQEAGK